MLSEERTKLRGIPPLSVGHFVFGLNAVGADIRTKLTVLAWSNATSRKPFEECFAGKTFPLFQRSLWSERMFLLRKKTRFECAYQLALEVQLAASFLLAFSCPIPSSFWWARTTKFLRYSLPSRKT